MRSDDPVVSKIKCGCTDFPNMAALTKSSTPGETQVMYANVSIGNKSLGVMVTDFP